MLVVFIMHKKVAENVEKYENVEKIGWGVDFFVDMMYHF